MVEKIERIQVVDTRGSGTNWVEGLVRNNFQRVEVMPSYNTGGEDNFLWKHGDLGSETRVYVDDNLMQLNEAKGHYEFHGHGFNSEIIRIPVNDPRYVGVDEEGDTYVKNNAVPLCQVSSSLDSYSQYL